MHSAETLSNSAAFNERVLFGVRKFEERIAQCSCALFVSTHGAPFERVGSGVLVTHRGQIFIFSSAHVIERRQSDQLKFSIGDELISVDAEIYSTLPDEQGSHQRDLQDCLVLRITSAIPAAVRAGALRVEEMASPSVNCVYLATGYPLKRFTEQERNLVMKSTSLLTEAERVGLKLNGTQHVVVRNEPYMLKDGKAELHKSLKGISGGGLFLLHGISVDVAHPIMDTLTLRLVAIVVEHRKKTMTGPASLICTSVGCHLFLADQIIDGDLSPLMGPRSGASTGQADRPTE
ncbi:hypothetical protein ABQF86_04125 [Xanthomonas campestris]|uniref:hypothetical protein n=1 Tax=Xanthomonas campestris TaxID=339 RepID=UPI0032E51F14